VGSLPPPQGRGNPRTRRWDAVVLGGALPGLVTAIVLGQRGARVLVLEEEAAARGFPGLREPFYLPGSERDGILGACLRALGVPLIDQRRVQVDPVGLQVVLPDARIDVGDAALSASEWVSWGLAKPQFARALARGLEAAADAERRALLAAPFVRSSRRLGLGALRSTPARKPLVPPLGEAAPAAPRGLPPELAELPPRLGTLLDAQLRGLARLGSAAPSPEVRARLLGAPFEGAATIRGAPWLREILRQRIRALYGEFRGLAGPFSLVAASGQPGIAQPGSEEVWAGRVLVVNAPLATLSRVVEQEQILGLLRTPPERHRRRCLHLRIPRHAVPEAMAPRVLRIEDPDAPLVGANLIALRVFPPAGNAELADVVASAVAPAESADGEALDRALEAVAAELLPFAERTCSALPEPRWDTDDPLPDPLPGAGWPADTEVRASSRQPVYCLDRSAVAALGVEGDLLLGWRTGEVIIADLA
jgi:hypothetical protein